jgi:hypothetical protein
MHVAIEFLGRALTLSRSCGDTNTQCSVLSTIANIQQTMGEVGTAQIHVKEARKLANMSGNLYQEASALWLAAQCTTTLGDYGQSIVHLRRAKDILGICGMLRSSLDSNINMSMAEVHLLKSDYTDARSIHIQLLQHTDQDPRTKTWALVNIAEIDVVTDATEDVVQKNLNKAKTMFSNMKYVHGVTCCEMILADFQLREGDISSAKDRLQDCLNLSWGKQIEVVSFCLERFADRNRWHTMECASPWPAIYLAYGHQSKEKLVVHKALLFLGDVFMAEGDDETAKSLFTVALEGFVFMDVHRS